MLCAFEDGAPRIILRQRGIRSGARDDLAKIKQDYAEAREISRSRWETMRIVIWVGVSDWKASEPLCHQGTH